MESVNEVKGLAQLIDTDFIKEYKDEKDQWFEDWMHGRIIIPIKTYEQFMAAGNNWSDAYVLYNHYYYTARLQKTNQVRANWK